MILLALLEGRARHGYELAKLVESESTGKLNSTWRRFIRCSTAWSASCW